MTKTRMEGRVDVIERNLGSIEELLAAMKMDQEQKLLPMKAYQDQKFARLASLLTSLVCGKGITDEGNTSNRTPQTGNSSSIQPILLQMSQCWMTPLYR